VSGKAGQLEGAMAEVPKIVQERLRVASTGAASHPEADVLTAFAERSLRGLERDKVLEHLWCCGECREVVSLALPASELAEVSLKSPRATWLTWPRMRWGLAAAGVVVVAALAIVLERRQESIADDQTPPPRAVSEARNRVVSAPALEDTAKEQDKLKASPAPTGNKERGETSSRVASQLANSEVAAAPAPIPSYANRGHVAGGALAHGPKMGIQANLPNQSQPSGANNFAPPVPVPPATPSAPSSNHAVNLGSDDLARAQAAAPVQTAQDLAVQSHELSQLAPLGGSAESKVDRAKPLETVIDNNSRKYAVSAAPSASGARSAIASAAQWTISSKGGLQRSLDQGATWQDVNVNASYAPGGAGYTFAKAKSSSSKEPAALQDQKQASPEPVFRAVAANGPEVWAGGANGLLCHSIDAGVHWTRIVPLSSGITLTGDIVTVDFPDPRHGRVATSTSEIWITGDAGQSWQKQ
jgi:hypothetical protein